MLIKVHVLTSFSPVITLMACAPNKAKNIARCLELAILMEASAPKPGNVSVAANFDKTFFAHFLASGVAASPSFESAAKRGIWLFQGRIDFSDLGVGRLIRNCINDINDWQHGGNTLLGTVILLLPIAVASGMTPVIDLEILRKNLKLIVESTTPRDAVNMYAAIKSANPGGLGKAPSLDVNDPDSVRRIFQGKVPLYKIFEIAQEYDTICSEWVNNYPKTFDLAYPRLVRNMQTMGNVNGAVVQTFLEVLAKVPDTFIARKTSIEKSREISLKAEHIFNLGGAETLLGRKRLKEFDSELRKSSNLLNPGTTADIISAALALYVLSGYRP